MKYPIETNGAANLQMLLRDMRYKGELLPYILEKSIQQAELLERYMLAYADAAHKGAKPPMWHEIIAEPKKFPVASEKYAYTSSSAS